MTLVKLTRSPGKPATGNQGNANRERLASLESVADQLRRAIAKESAGSPPNRPLQTSPHTEPPINLNAARDTAYAHETHPAFSNVLTVFTQEWVGIRAAAGSFPGHKLAIAKNAQMGPAAIRRILDIVHANKISVVLVHGFSEGVMRAARALRIAQPELRILCVWHGSVAALCFDEERTLARTMFDLATRGVFDRISIMKLGAHLLHPKAVPYLLPNLPPNITLKRHKPARFDGKPAALFGSWNNTWKNMYSNLAAAGASTRIDRIFGYNSLDIPLPGIEKYRRIEYGSRQSHLAFLSTVDLVLNATILDCHPMIEMEAISVGTPILRAPLDLDFGNDHPFEKLLTVQSPNNIADLVDAIDRIADVPPEEIAEIISDYCRLVCTTSLDRYAQFMHG